MAQRPKDHRETLVAKDELLQKQAEQRRKEEQRRKQVTERQARAYGTVVLATTKLLFDVDQLAGLALESAERAKADPQLMEVWRERGQIFFRGPAADAQLAAVADSLPASKPAGNSGGGGKRGGNGAARVESGRDAAAGTPDLLGGLAADRPGGRPETKA